MRRCGTATADVPALSGDRITVVCSPGIAKQRKGALLTNSPPDTEPGEALSVTEHRKGTVTLLLRPPLPGSQSTLPSWALPVVVLLGGSDAALGLLDPALPLLVAAGP